MKKRLAAVVVAGLLSLGGLTFIQSHEGLRYTSYPDPATGGAPWTICWGHTGPEVVKGMTVSRAQCEKWYRQDVAKAETVVQMHVTFPLRQGQYDALTSFVFNTGPNKLPTSTLLKLTNQGKWLQSCDEYPKWKYANKKVMRGLVVRRTEERALCRKPGEYVYVP